MGARRGEENTRHTVADLCPYWVWPATGGGPLRVYHMNRAVADRVRVLQFSARPTFGHMQGRRSAWMRSQMCRIAGQYQEYQYFDLALMAASYALYRCGLHSDLFMSSLVKALHPRPLRRILDAASVIQVEHPWLFDLAWQAAKGRPVVYVAHNVEAALWADRAGTLLNRRYGALERRAVQRASAIVVMSAHDGQALGERYGAAPARMCVIPNGVDLEARRPASPAAKRAARARLGLDDRPVLLFVGSDHYPNKEALAHIARWQGEFGASLDVQVVVVGSVGRGRASTPSLRIEGFVPEIGDYLAAADIALNPLCSGSGTSLKVVEYLACGLPTITTPVGMRGLDLAPGRDLLLGAMADFVPLVQRLIADPELRSRLAANGRRAVERQYGWKRLGRRMLAVYDGVAQCASA